MKDKCIAEGKEIFDTKQEAYREIGKRGWHGTARVYQCTKCYAFHITSQRKLHGKSPAMKAMEYAVTHGQTKVIERLSNDKTLHSYRYRGKEYHFVYGKRTKKIKVLSAKRIYKTTLKYE